MRHLSTIILLIFGVIFISFAPAYCAVKGGIEYSIPVDYSKLTESELQEKAKDYFFLAQNVKDGEVNEDVTNALILYTVLQNVNPLNVEYSVRLGRLYDKIGRDRYAKGSFSRAISVNSDLPEAYFYYGEFYYKRQLYRKALKYYQEAYKKGYETNYDILYRMGDIYAKLGDTKSALKYLNEASKQSPNPDLDNKIKGIEGINSSNSLYYRGVSEKGAK